MSGYSAQFHKIRVTPATVWLFVSLSDGQSTGWGEATLAGEDTAVSACFSAVSEQLSTGDLAALRFDTLPEAALSSALRQAQSDLHARRADVPLWRHLGGATGGDVGVYANINRTSRDRAPDAMAATARRALAQGHTAIKIAPFDEVCRAMDSAQMARAMQPGLHRIAAVRDAIGARRLMVDCHWRFDRTGAEAVIDACAGFDLYWLECPIPETPAVICDLVALRARANDAGMRLAGLETAILRAGFAPYLVAGAYDVMMPDVKYCGGPVEMRAIAADLARQGVAFSPHNPSGPICHAHSMHLCAAIAGADLLETQFDETPMFDSLVNRPPPQVVAGRAALPAGAGLGLSLIPRQPGAVP